MNNLYSLFMTKNLHLMQKLTYMNVRVWWAFGWSWSREDQFRCRFESAEAAFPESAKTFCYLDWRVKMVLWRETLFDRLLMSAKLGTLGWLINRTCVDDLYQPWGVVGCSYDDLYPFIPGCRSIEVSGRISLLGWASIRQFEGASWS